MDESVVQGSKHGPIKLCLLGKHAACDSLSLVRQAHELFAPIFGVSDSPDVAAFFQTVEQKHQNIFIQREVLRDLFLSYRFSATGGQQNPNLPGSQAELARRLFGDPLLDDEGALG